MNKTVAILGALDTKGAEFEFLKNEIEKRGCQTFVINSGVLGEPPFSPDVGAEETPAGEEEPAGDDILKVAPGKRDDKPFITRDEAGRIITTTPASKGKMYRPKKDGRVKKLRMGMRSTAVPEFATGNTRRSKLGLPKPSDLFEDVENIFEGMVEKKETNYTLEEGFEDHSKEVDRLLESLEKRNDQIQ